MNTNQIQPHGETFFLNLRFLLIVCVFIGNAIEPLITRMEGIHSLYMWIFTFHMPLFVFVTGYFAKSNLSGEAGRKVLLQIAFQYVIFQSIYSLLDVTVFQVNHIHHSFFAPYLLLWFLASHIGWRLLLLMMRKCTPVQQLAISITLGVVVGYLQIDGAWLSVSRTFVFLPFFIAGYHFSFEKIAQWFTLKTRTIAMSVSLLLFVVIALTSTDISPGWLYGSMTYGQLGHHEWYAGLYRFTLYLLQIIAGVTFLSFVPKGASLMTDYGRRTLYVFLLHGFIIRIAAISPLYHYVNNEWSAILVILGATCFVLLLSQTFIKKWTSPIIEPSIQWVLALQRRAVGGIGTASKH